MTVSRLLSAVAVALLIAGLTRTLHTAPAAGQNAGCAVNPAELAIDSEEQAALDAINALRAGGGFAAVTLTPSLGQAAAHKSATMAATGIFSHDDPGRSWLQRVQECGYRASQSITENLAMGTETGRATVQMWRESPGHHQNMMNPAMRAAGIARVRDAAGAWYWTANFGGATEAGAETRAAGPPAPPASGSSGVTPATQLLVGGPATVNAGSGECLNVRSAAGRGASVNSCVPDGTVVRVQAGPVTADGAPWWQLEGLGWAAGEFLISGAIGGGAPVTSIAAIVRLPAIEQDPCIPASGTTSCDPVRLALWQGDYDTWVSWRQQPSLSRGDVPLITLHFRAEQGSSRSTAVLQGLGR